MKGRRFALGRDPGALPYPAAIESRTARKLICPAERHGAAPESASRAMGRPWAKHASAAWQSQCRAHNLLRCKRVRSWTCAHGAEWPRTVPPKLCSTSAAAVGHQLLPRPGARERAGLGRIAMAKAGRSHPCRMARWRCESNYVSHDMDNLRRSEPDRTQLEASPLRPLRVAGAPRIGGGRNRVAGQS